MNHHHRIPPTRIVKIGLKGKIIIKTGRGGTGSRVVGRPTPGRVGGNGDHKARPPELFPGNLSPNAHARRTWWRGLVVPQTRETAFSHGVAAFLIAHDGRWVTDKPAYLMPPNHVRINHQARRNNVLELSSRAVDRGL